MRYAFVLLFASAMSAQEPFVCGTSAANDASVEARGRWIAMRESLRAAKTGSPAGNGAYARNNVIVLPADDSTAPFLRAFDLTGKTLTFTHNGSESFTETTSELNYDDALGVQLPTDVGTRSGSYTLASFDFP